MLHSESMDRHDALVELLRLPDPPDLRTPSGVGRGRKYRCGGDKLRQPEVKRQLAMAYLQYATIAALEALGRDESRIVSVRRSNG